MQSYDIHPICQIIPLMNHDDINRLAEDIVQNGLLEPIVLYEGKILDGRHRYEACARCGVTPRFVDFDGSDPIQFVLSHNIARRHLTPSQLAMVAARVANMRQGERTDIAQICAKSQSDAAKEVGVSRRSVQTARKVINSGKDDLVDAVDAGKLTVSAAAEIVNEPDELRSEIIGSGRRRRWRREQPEPGKVASNSVELFLEVWEEASDEDRRTIYDIARRWAEVH